MSRMLPSVTVACRKVRNDRTGLDLYIHKDQQLSASRKTVTLYSVIVVSNLPVYGASEGNTVQYVLERSHSDLEKLHQQLSNKFSGTLIPAIPKKPISIIDTPAKAVERMRRWEAFLQFCAETAKIVNSKAMLKFLSTDIANTQKEEDMNLESSDSTENHRSSKDARTTVKLFDDVTDDKEVIFESDGDEDDNGSLLVVNLSQENTSRSRFEQDDADLHHRRQSAKLYKDFNTESIENKTTISTEPISESEDVLSSDDDFEELMKRLNETKRARGKIPGELKAHERPTIYAGKSTTEHALTIADISPSDVSQYISENTATSQDVDLEL